MTTAQLQCECGHDSSAVAKLTQAAGIRAIPVGSYPLVRTCPHIRRSLLESLDHVRRLAISGGPSEEEYPELHAAFDTIAEARRSGALSDQEFRSFVHNLPVFTWPCALVGHTYLRPRGYPGDFDLLRKLHTAAQSADPSVARWDRLVIEQIPSRAVRGRGEVLRRCLEATAGTDESSRLSLLTVACGSSHDVLSALEGWSGRAVPITCVDADPEAVRQSLQLLTERHGDATGVVGNVVRLSLGRRYRVVWCAGLFDYLTDTIFVRAAKRLWSHVGRGGLLVIGNFADDTIGRTFMEFGDWFLFYRSGRELRRLVAEATGEVDIEIMRDATGANLFAVARARE